MGEPRYKCPNGHSVELVVMLPCNVSGCMAMIGYEPTAHGLALDRQLGAAVSALALIAASRAHDGQHAIDVGLARNALEALGIAPFWRGQ
jgi:hypothetical protein